MPKVSNLRDIKTCDFCKKEMARFYADGKTQGGSWANMCLPCFDIYGRGFGTGVGQLFQATYDPSTDTVKWKKVAG